MRIPDTIHITVEHTVKWADPEPQDEPDAKPVPEGMRRVTIDVSKDLGGMSCRFAAKELDAERRPYTKAALLAIADAIEADECQ